MCPARLLFSSADAVLSLMKLATPVKSPGRRGGAGDTTPGARPSADCGVEMTPTSLFRKSRQPGELAGQLQSPFQSPFKNFHFSPSCLFSPPDAGTLDFPLGGSGDTPGPGSSRDLWSPNRREARGEGRGARGPVGRNGDGVDGGDGNNSGGSGGSSGGGGGGGGSGAPSSCGKRKGKALFTDKRGPQDHSRGLGQAWCLGTPGGTGNSGGGGGKSSSESSVGPLSGTGIPATPERASVAGGAHGLPPTPRLMPTTPPSSRSSRETTAEAAAGGGGDHAAGMLMGLRSPESLSVFNGGATIAHSLFAGLEEDGGERSTSNHPRTMVDRSWGDNWENRRNLGADDGGGGHGQGVVGGNINVSSIIAVPNSASAKRHRRFSSSAVSLRDAHCKGSFTIERGTLIRSARSSSSSPSVVAGCPSVRSRVSSSGNSSSGSGSDHSRRNRGDISRYSGKKCRTAAAAASADRGVSSRGAISRGAAACRVKNPGRSIVEVPLSPRKPVLSPDQAPLKMSRRSVSISPSKSFTVATAARKAVTNKNGTPSTAPRSSKRKARLDKSRKGAVAVAAAAASVGSAATSTASSAPASNTAPLSVTPSPVAAPLSRSSSRSSKISAPSRLTISGKGGTPVRLKAEPGSSSFNSPEPTTSVSNDASSSSRRGKATVSAQKQQEAKKKVQPAAVVVVAAVTPSSAAAVAAVVESGCGDEGGDENAPTTCNCKKSKCLKLYCECFQRRQYCSDCNCKECLNTERTEDLRQVAIMSTIERNPHAFVSKFEQRAGKRAHNAGCNCKKSACLKKYCECFQASVACGTNCKCSNCKNYEGAAGGRKRRAVEVVLPFCTPPRVSARGRGVFSAAAVGGDQGRMANRLYSSTSVVSQSNHGR